MGCSKSGVPAEIDLMRWSEPAQIPCSVWTSFDKGRFGKVIFLSDRQHQGVCQPVIENENCGRVPSKEMVGEGVDLKHFHGAKLTRFSEQSLT